MGVYALSEVKANGAPRFVKRLAGGGAHYLYRNSTREWMATDDESNIAKNAGYLLSSRAADLPSKAGLGWQYADKGDWPDDPNLRCTEVTGPAAASPRRARGGGGGRRRGGGREEGRRGRGAQPADEPPSRLAASDLPPSIPSPTSPSFSAHDPAAPARWARRARPRLA